MKTNETDKWAEGLSTKALIQWSNADEGMFGEEVFLANEELKRRQRKA